MKSVRKHFPWMTPEEEPIIWAIIMEKAATRYEEAGQLRDAAECWLDLGRPDRAGELYLRDGDLPQATPVLLAAGRYLEALNLYAQWETNLPQNDLPNRIKAIWRICRLCMQLRYEVRGG